MEQSTRSIDIPNVSAATPRRQPTIKKATHKKATHTYEQKCGPKIAVPVIENDENETVAMLREVAGF